MKEKREPVATQVVLRKNNLNLVEWQENGYPKRAWVTPDMVVGQSGSTAMVEQPGQGIPYGVDFSRVEMLSVTPHDVDRELKRRGIWTIADLRARPNDAVGALQAVYGFDLARLLQWAKDFEKSME